MKKYMSEEKLIEKFIFQCKAGELVASCLSALFRQTRWTPLVQTMAWFKLLTRWMSRSLHLSDRKAAYHVPHRLATDICHLQSSASPAELTHTYTLSRIRTLFCSCRVPTSKASLPLISLITQTVCSSTPPSPVAQWNEKEMGAKGKEKTEGTSYSLREAHMF